MRKIRQKSNCLKKLGAGCRKIMSFVLVVGLILTLMPNGNIPGLVYGAGSNTELAENTQAPEAASTNTDESSEETTDREATEAPELETTTTEETATNTEVVDDETTELATTEAATEAILERDDDPRNRVLSDYHPDDVAVINNIIRNNGLNWRYNDPDSWPTTDTGGSGYIKWSSTPENKRIEALSIAYKNLTGAVDVSALTQLQTLRCTSNRLTNLDISNNSQLQTLECNNNQINLDVSSNFQLQTLSCDSNGLTNLDVSNNSQLKTLSCDNNRLTNLDVSNNSQLQTLSCSGNSLANLDVSNNSQLQTLRFAQNSLVNLDVSNNSQLQTLSCSGNSLANLDVSNNPKLQYLYCSENQLMDLDVRSNIKLKILLCNDNRLMSLNVSGAPIESIECNNNNLANLDLSGSPKLRELICDSNNLTSLDVSRNALLERLNCSNNSLNNLTTWTGIYKSFQIRYLDCSNNRLTSLDISLISAISDLMCQNNQLTNLDVSQNPQLRSLWCESNQLTNLDVSQNPELQTLRCESNQLTNLDVSQNPQLVSLYCGSNQLTNLDVSQKPQLVNLDFQNNNNLRGVNLRGVLSLVFLYQGSQGCPNLHTIVSSAGDTISLQASPGGSVEFVRMQYADLAKLEVRAVSDSGTPFFKWDTLADRITYVIGNNTTPDIMVNVATGADTTITALFSAPPSVSTPAFTNGDRTSVDFNGSYLANGYTMDYSANACRYRKIGDTTWSTAGAVLTYNDTAGTYAGSITGLASNTAYELEVYLENTGGGTWSAPGTFVTTLDLTVDTPSINMPSLEATISGRYGVGDQPVTVEVTYGLDPLLLTGAATINATVNPGLKTFTATIPGLTMGTLYYYQVTAVNSTSNSPVSSGILSFTLGHQVVVRHVDKTGTVLPGEAATGDLSYVTTSGSPYTVPTKTVTNYEPAYYTIGSNPTRYPLTTTQTITGATDITVYYASTLIRVVYPNTPMEFDALDTNHGNVKSPDYLFENQSDLPLRVSFKKMGVVNNAGLRFVTNAASRDEIHLNLEAAGSSNGFTNDLTGIVPDTTYTVPHVFGTLDGALPMSGDTGHNQGKLKIGGYFVGPFTVTAKRPQVEFTFNFYLMDP